VKLSKALPFFFIGNTYGNTLNPHGYRICCRVAVVAVLTIKDKFTYARDKK
jgi:hypothetical protein